MHLHFLSNQIAEEVSHWLFGQYLKVVKLLVKLMHSSWDLQLYLVLVVLFRPSLLQARKDKQYMAGLKDKLSRVHDVVVELT